MSRSRAAAIGALYRALELRRPARKRVIFDPLADALAGADRQATLLRAGRLVIPPLARYTGALQTGHCVHHRALDGLVLGTLEGGFTQVVSIGAGFETRASRFAAHFPRTRWFEVDHPETLAEKWRRLDGLPGVNPFVARVPLDLSTGALAPGLVAAGLDKTAPTLFLIEEAADELTPARLDSLLASVGQLAEQRRLIFSFPTASPAAPEQPLAQLWRRLQPQRRTLTRPEVAALLERHGFLLTRAFTPGELVEIFAPEARSRPMQLHRELALADAIAGARA